jgi:hypothetical protein
MAKVKTRERLIAAGLWDKNDPGDPSQSEQDCAVLFSRCKQRFGPKWRVGIDQAPFDFADLSLYERENEVLNIIRPTQEEAICEAALWLAEQTTAQ